MEVDGSVPRVLVLGFDALDFRYLDRFRDDLPNFARLRREGVEAPLRSTFPPWTASAWPSLYTGADPSHHGVYGFFRFDDYPDAGTIVTRNHVELPALWNYLSAESLPSVVLNVPVTHPAEPIEGVVVPGYLAHEEADGHPRGIRDELSTAIGEPYRIYSRTEMSDDGGEKLAGYLDLIDLRKRAAVHLLTERPWRLAAVQVQKTDAVFHNFDDDASFRRVYEAADELVGAVLDAVTGRCNVIVCSDHGIGPARGYRIYVNEVLHEHGYLETTDDSAGPSLAAEKSRLVGRAGPTETSSGEEAIVRMVDGLRRVGLTPDRIYGVAEYLGVAPRLTDVLPTALIRDSVSRGVDYRRSAAYCPRRTWMGIRINLDGREPDGVVAPADYESVRSELIDLLSGLETPDGRRAFDRVVRAEELQDGPLVDRGPDVLVLPRGMDNTLSTSLYGRRFTPVDKYDHKFDGVFLGAGPGFSAGFDGGTLSLTDVAPVVMALLDLPVPTLMTGEVPPELLTVPARTAAYEGVTYGGIEAEEPADDAEVLDRLDDLGYL